MDEKIYKTMGSAREKRLVLREQGFCMQMIPFSMQVLLLVSAVLLDIPLSVFTKRKTAISTVQCVPRITVLLQLPAL